MNTTLTTSSHEQAPATSDSSKMTTVWVYADPQPSLEAVAATAIELCVRQDASLTIVGVLETADEPLFKTPAGRDLVNLLRQDKQERLEALHAQAAQTLKVGRVKSRLLEGEVGWHTLATHAVEEKPDLIVVPAEDGKVAGRFGTLSHHLFRKCPSPVWSILSSDDRLPALPKRTLVAVDPGAKGSDERLLSIEVLRVAQRVLAQTNTELHLAHAWSLYGEHRIAWRLGPKTAQSFLDEQLRYAKAYTSELLAEAGCQGVFRVHYRKGEPGSAIPALAEEMGADLVVLGTAARRGLQGFFMGSAAETILGRLGRSALVVKRPGFVSPVIASK